jgi:hypothetical protein
MRAIRGVIGAALLFGCSVAFAAEWAYSDGDVRVALPAQGWTVQTDVPGAPNVRAAFVRPRPADKGSVISIAIDGTPDLTSPADYAKRTLALLAAPPYGFKIRKAGEFTWKGNVAARAEYTDSSGKKFHAQATIRTPRGGMLLATLNSPDAATYAEDLKVFFAFLDKVEVPPAVPASPKESP